MQLLLIDKTSKVYQLQRKIRSTIFKKKQARRSNRTSKTRIRQASNCPISSSRPNNPSLLKVHSIIIINTIVTYYYRYKLIIVEEWGLNEELV